MNWGLKVFEIDKSTITAPSAIGQVAGEDISSLQNKANEPALATHPFFFVKPYEARGNGIDSVVATHLNVGTWMEKASTLTNNNVSRNDILIREFFDTETLARGVAVVFDRASRALCCRAHGPY